MTWEQELIERLRAGLPLQVLGQASLEGPLRRLVVLGRSDPDSGAWLAAVLMGTLRTPPGIESGFATRSARGGALYVLDEGGRDRFVVSRGLLDQVVISCGGWPLLLPLVGAKARPRPVGDRAALASDLDAFCALVAAAAPGAALTLSATGLTVDAAFGSLGKLGRAAAEAVRRGPGGGRPPGSVYTPGEEGESVGFEDIGGLEDAKVELETICLAVRDPAAFSAWGARPPRGVLLFGPPGTGKTMLARALAREARARFIHVRATDVVSKWYGEAEKRLQEAFDWARRERPAVLFFDEIDALARSREDSHEVTHRLVSTFLENMDGLSATPGVIVVAATNRPDALDEAIMRPGRFDRLVEVPLPGPAGRRAIFQVHSARASRAAGRELFDPPSEADWERLLAASDGHSGADIAEAVRRALEVKVRSGATLGRVAPDELLAATAGLRRSA